MEKEPLSDSGPAQLTTSVLSVEGMTCGACTAAVERALRPMDGVVDFKISLLAERAVVTHDASLSPEKIAAEIEDAGFDAAVISSESFSESGDETSSTVRISVYGMLEPQSTAHLEQLLGDTPGVVSAKVDLNKQVVTVTFQKRLVTVRTIVGIIESIGFDAILADTEHANAQLQSLAKTAETRQWKNAFLLSLLSAIPVLVLDTLIPWLLPQAWDFGSFPLIPGLLLRDSICGIFAATTLFGVGRRFYISAWKSIKHGSPTMDVLVVLGTSAAFFFSCLAIIVAIIFPPHKAPKTVFDASTMLITFITLGRWIECRAKGQTSTALSELMSLAPSTAVIYDDPVYVEKLASTHAVDASPSSSSDCLKRSTSDRSDTPTERNIPTELIEAGDVVVLRPGDKVPADGVVIFGESWINESMVTGEAEPVLKKRGSDLLAGTVNGSGHIDLRITRAGKDTRLSQIVDLVHQAQTNRAPIQRLADQVAGYFVPVIIVAGREHLRCVDTNSVHTGARRASGYVR